MALNSRLRNYVRVYDNVISTETANSIIESWSYFENNDMTYATVIDDREVYEQCNITQRCDRPESKNIQLLMMSICESYTRGYVNDLGISKQNRFSEQYDGNQKKAYDHVFFMRKYDKTGFYEPNYGSRCHLSSNRFLSYILFLGNDPEGYLLFDPIIGQMPIMPRVGRMVIFPSNWLFPIKELAPKTEKFQIIGYAQWANNDNK